DGAEELAPDGGVVEQVADVDARAGGAAPGPHRREVAAVAADLRAAGVGGGARLEHNLGDAADGGEGLAAEAEGADAAQVGGGAELAGGVAGEGEREVLGGDAAAVIDHADQLGAPLFHLDVDARAARIDAVFEELLEDAGGALDDLAGGDLGDDVRGELAD